MVNVPEQSSNSIYSMPIIAWRSISFTILFDDKGVEEYGTFQNAVYNVYSFLYAAIYLDLEAIETSNSKVASAILIAIFMFFIDIILLNLIIATLTNKYEEVKRNATSANLILKAKFLRKYSALKIRSKFIIKGLLDFIKWVCNARDMFNDNEIEYADAYIIVVKKENDGKS